MRFDFESIIDRTGKDALAVDAFGPDGWGMAPDQPEEGYDFIPMWVADMNFATCPAVTDAMMKRLQHPLFGYYREVPEYYEKIIRWRTERDGHSDLLKEHIGYENGVHGFITSAVNILTSPGESILLHKPAYIGFALDIEGQGRKAAYSELIRDENGVYRMDYEDMERQIRDKHIHTVIFCSPHNPCGRVWEREELERAMALFEKYDCTVISDEIWADIVRPGHTHIPTQTVSPWAREHTAAAYALSKTFNLAAMCGSYHIIYNRTLRDRLTHYSSATNYNSQNVLTMHALLGAYTEEGSTWVDELNRVIARNCDYLSELLNHVEGVSATKPEGTYMIFADLTDYAARTGKNQRKILKDGWKAGVGWQDGIPFGGPCHVRINAALPFSRVKEAGDRLLKNVFAV